ncbi:hypothetical protein [Phycicoccus sp. CSK15P-2]|uniref:hypothetical protein n=1 Tax=Phycicoccus sp. CSK15P-2 TaxID=2807627 RepID=UPI001EF30D70|nr:hypothetical protein [Phycicoccus sp. CSK15P-2]
MFAHHDGPEHEAVAESAVQAFTPVLEVFRGQDDEGGAPERTAVIFLATLQGTAGLVACGVIPVAEVGPVVDDVVGRFTDTAR